MEDRLISVSDFNEEGFVSFVKNNDAKSILKYLDENDFYSLNINNICRIIKSLLCNCNDLDNLFNDEDFCSVFITSCRLNSILVSLPLDICEKVLSILLSLDISNEDICDLFKRFSSQTQIKLLPLLKNKPCILYNLIFSENYELICEIISKYDIDLTSEYVDIEKLFNQLKKIYLSCLDKKNKNGSSYDVHLSSKLITEELSEKIWDRYELFTIRQLISNATYVTDTSIINNYIKDMEDKILLSLIKNPLLPSYKNVYDNYLLLLDLKYSNEKGNCDKYDKLQELCAKMRKTMSSKELGIIVTLECQKFNSKEELFSFLQMLLNEEISNYIIDYHFEDIFYNVMLDLKQLIRFYEKGYIKLDKEHVRIYRKVLNIDKISIVEKIKLHLELKKYDVIGMFYDDMLKARRVVNNDIKNKALNKDTIKQYRDKELSDKYGIDIYVIDDKDLCGIIRCNDKHSNKPPTTYSYSLVGNKRLDSYKSYYRLNTFLYDASKLNPDQIAHLHPEDSFSFYFISGSSEMISNKVNTLITTKELLGENGTYSEIVLMEKGTEISPIDSDMPSLKPIALYFCDILSDRVVEQARSKNVGVLLVNVSPNNYDNKYGSGPMPYIEDATNTYYTGSNKSIYEEKRRRKSLF